VITRRWTSESGKLCLAIFLAVKTVSAQTLPSNSSALSTQALGNILLVQSGTDEARAQAAARLTLIHTPAASAILVAALRSPDEQAADAAAKAIADAGWADPAFIAPLEDLLGSNAVMNGWAATILRQFGGNAAVGQKILQCANDGQLPAAARVPVVKALGVFISKEAAGDLVDLVQDQNQSDELRQAAGLALAEMSGEALGQDGRKWRAWWQKAGGMSAADFTAAMTARRAAQFPALINENDRLQHGLDRMLKSLYFTSPAADQARILDSLLTSEAPEIRRSGAQIVEIDAAGGRPMSTHSRERLMAMLGGDSDATVRSAAAAALGLDPTAGPLLLSRLNEEADPDARVALLGAIAPRQDPAAMGLAIQLLNDPSPLVAQAAADLLAAGGSTLRDAKNADLRGRAEAALLSALDRNATGDFPLFRRSVTAALAGLGDMNLYERMVRLSSASEPEGVRIEALGGLGLLAQTTPDIAAVLADFVDGGGTPNALRLKAAQVLAGVATTAYVDRLVDRLHRNPEPRDDIRAAIWLTVQGWMSNLSDDRLVRLAERLRDEKDYAREVEVRRFFAVRLESRKTDDALQTAASQWETMATRELDDLGKPAEAAADFARVIAYDESKSATGEDLPHNPFRGETAALLAVGPPYAAAVKFAADTLSDAKRASVLPDVLEEFPRFAERLSGQANNRDSLDKAIALAQAFDDAKLAVPASLSYVADNLKNAADTARRNVLNIGGQ